jgi:BASS family bile acid:Na+ symporter
MQATLVTTLLLPLALGIIMFGLGLGLALDDFRRVARFPRAIVVGLVLQTGVLTACAFGLARLFGLSPELAIGLVILAAAPGGATANVYSHLARGDVALNITLTAINSALSLLTLPLIVSLALEAFLGQGQYVPPPFRKIIEVAVIIVLPVVLGMAVRARSPGFAARFDRPMRLFAVLVLALLIAVAIAGEWGNVVGYFAAVGLACLAFNLVSLLAGYAVPLALRLPRRQAIAIAMEIGIHNGTLAIFIALNVLGNGTMSVPAAVYSLIMFVTAAGFALWLTRRHAADAPTPAS